MRTLYDLVSHILDSEDASADSVDMRRALRAAVWGAEQAQTRHEWLDYNTTIYFTLYSPVETVASVDEDGVLTLDAGEPDLPGWTDQAEMVATDESLAFRVERKVSDRIAKIASWPSDAASSINVRFQHSRFVLPNELRTIYGIRNESEDHPITSISAPSLISKRNAESNVPGDVRFAAVTRGTGRFGRQTEIRFHSPPAADTKIGLSCRRVPNKPSLLHDCGLVSIESGIATLGKAVPNRQVRNAVLLLSGNDRLPDPEYGFRIESPNPIVHTLNVLGSNDSSHLVIDDESLEASGKGAYLTDVLDFPEFAYSAATRYAEAEFKKVGRGDTGEYWQSLRQADNELRLAMEQESVFDQRVRADSMSRTSILERPERISVEDA